VWFSVAAMIVLLALMGGSVLRGDWLAYALFKAIERGDMRAVEGLMEAGVPIESECRGSANSFLEFAIHRRNREMARGSTPLLFATCFKQWKIAQRLIERGANVNATDGAGTTALMYASFEGDVNSVRLLLIRGANPNAKWKDGSTILDDLRNRPEVAKLLIHAGGKM
jgi:ankyrin repeat protein